MKDYKLDEEEKEIMEAFEKGKLKKVNNLKKIKKQLQETAHNTIIKSKHISLRISEKDLTKLKSKSVETGIPYQTLIGSLIHQYVEGKINIRY